MPRRLRIQFPGAIYHVMSRGNVRQDVVDDDHDRQQFMELLAAQAARWEVISFVLMTNHFHLLVRIPIANLAAGMQRFLSAHAKGIAVRHQRPGHLFQGRYKAELIEDESYYWTVSRYIHLNPVRAHLVALPEDWPWSSFPGYLLPARRLSWVGNERLWQAWSGEFGGNMARAGSPWELPPRAPTDPDVPVKEASGSSRCGFAVPHTTRSFRGDTLVRLGVLGVVPTPCPQRGAPFAPRGPEGPFPRFKATMRHCDSLPPISPRFVAFAWRYHRCVPFVRPRQPRTRTADQPGVGKPVSPPGCYDGDDWVSQVPGEPF